MAIYHSHLSLLALFDVSSAFDMVVGWPWDSSSTFATILWHLIIPLFRFKSKAYRPTSRIVKIDGCSWRLQIPLDQVWLGVQQGSVLRPILYILYTAGIHQLFAKHGVTGYLYADDIQAFVRGSPII